MTDWQQRAPFVVLAGPVPPEIEADIRKRLRQHFEAVFDDIMFDMAMVSGPEYCGATMTIGRDDEVRLKPVRTIDLYIDTKGAS